VSPKFTKRVIKNYVEIGPEDYTSERRGKIN